MNKKCYCAFLKNIIETFRSRAQSVGRKSTTDWVHSTQSCIKNCNPNKIYNVLDINSDYLSKHVQFDKFQVKKIIQYDKGFKDVKNNKKKLSDLENKRGFENNM